MGKTLIFGSGGAPWISDQDVVEVRSLSEAPSADQRARDALILGAVVSDMRAAHEARVAAKLKDEKRVLLQTLQEIASCAAEVRVRQHAEAALREVKSGWEPA